MYAIQDKIAVCVSLVAFRDLKIICVYSPNDSYTAKASGSARLHVVTPSTETTSYHAHSRGSCVRGVR